MESTERSSCSPVVWSGERRTQCHALHGSEKRSILFTSERCYNAKDMCQLISLILCRFFSSGAEDEGSNL